jgi:hypothetical protein
MTEQVMRPEIRVDEPASLTNHIGFSAAQEFSRRNNQQAAHKRKEIRRRDTENY